MTSEGKDNRADEKGVEALVALKRFEQPDPFLETRLLAALRSRLAHTAPGLAWHERLLEWLTAGPVPAVTVAALTLTVGGALFYWAHWKGAARAPGEVAVSRSETVQTNIASAAPAEDLEAESIAEIREVPYQKPVFVFEFPSNREPIGPVRMGPTAVPVRYDF